MNAPPVLVMALVAVSSVVLIDRVAKRMVGPLRGRRVGPLGSRRAQASRLIELHRSLHVQGVHQRRLWGSERGAAVVLLSIVLGIGVLHELLGEAAARPLLALSAALGGATSNAIDLRRHGGIVNCVTWDGRLAFNLADVAIVGGVVAALLLALGTRVFEGAAPW